MTCFLHDREVADIAARLILDPRRVDDVHRFHQVLIDALNATHDENCEQDLLALMDGFAHTLAQLLGGFDETSRCGYLSFVTHRAVWLADAYAGSGNIAKHRQVTG
jgi:hypothetical protein